MGQLMMMMGQLMMDRRKPMSRFRYPQKKEGQ